MQVSESTSVGADTELVIDKEDCGFEFLEIKNIAA